MEKKSVSDSRSTCLIVGHFRSACGLQRVADLMALDMEAKKENFLRVDVAPNFNWSVTLPRNDVFDLSQVASYQPARIICPLIVAGNALPVFELLRNMFGEQTPIIPFCHWEMTRFPESWRKVAEMAAEVWLPTPFVKSAFDSTFPDLADKSRIFRNPIAIDPFPVTTPNARESARRIFDLRVDAFVAGFTFASSSCFDRKNPLGAIQAFRQAFGDRSTNFLLIRCTDPDFYPQGLANLRQAVKEVEGLRLILKGEPQHRLEDFYAAIDVLLSLHRSEGYGLTIAEAVQTGARAISTEWGLAPELAALPRVHTVGQKLIPVRDSQGFFGNFAHLEWADPNVDEAADRLRQIADEIGNSWLTAPFKGMAVNDESADTALSPKVAGECKMNPIDVLAAASEELALVDVGARWGANERWNAIFHRAKVLCFEPDPEECANLAEHAPDNVHYQPVALGASSGELDIYITENPACSSVYPSVRALHEFYPPCRIQAPRRVIRVPCRPLDDVLAELEWAKIDCLKLDVQGYELSVLTGAKRALASCSLVDVEVEFNPLYEGQPLFCDVDRFLRDCGFVLWRLDNLVHYAPEIVLAAETSFHIAAEPSRPIVLRVPSGQLFWSQAQYVRAEYPPTRREPLFGPQAVRAALLAASYGFWDLALELLRKSGRQELEMTLRDCLRV